MTASSTASARITVDSSSASIGSDSALSAARASAPPGSMQGPPGGMRPGMPMMGNHPGVMMNMENINQEIMLIPQNVLAQLKQETRVGDKEVNSMSMNDKKKIVQLWRSRRGSQQVQQQAQQQQQRNEGSSTSPSDEAASTRTSARYIFHSSSASTSSESVLRAGPPSVMQLGTPNLMVDRFLSLLTRVENSVINKDIMIIPQRTLEQLKQETGAGDKEVNSMSMNDKRTIALLWRSRREPQQVRQRAQQQQQKERNKRSSTNSGNEHESQRSESSLPKRKRQRRSRNDPRGMTDNSIANSTFLHNSMANSLEDLEPELFRPDTDINFERDFGQWFNPDDSLGLDTIPNPIGSTSATPVPGPPGSMTDTSIANSIFSHDFINSVVSSLEDFRPDLFRPDADINFERDFGQWFNPDDSMRLDMK